MTEMTDHVAAKACSKCGQVKAITDFHLCAGRRHPWCILCRRVYVAAAKRSRKALLRGASHHVR